jgi:indolepyruvate ferredoxin oxidoreductase
VPDGAAPWDLLVTGVGGTGVVTVGAVVAMAAHLQGTAPACSISWGLRKKAGRC